MAFTFDDILLIPQFSEIVPTEVSTESFFARDIVLKMPFSLPRWIRSQSTKLRRSWRKWEA